jgi:sugar-phosphatase
MILTCCAILFDLDGTLVNSIAAVDRAWTIWCGEHGLDPAVVLPQIHGRRAADSVRAVAPHLNASTELARLEELESSDTRGVTITPGASVFLATLPQGSWGIVTSGSPAVANSRMRATGLPRPDVFVTADMVANGKPAPDPFLKGAELLGVGPHQCLAFEDAEPGIRSAKAAGMEVVSIGHTRNLATAGIKDFEPVRLISNVDGILKIEILSPEV